MKRRPVVYYISAHGYGHGVRSCDVIRCFNALYPDVPVVVVSTLPMALFTARISSPLVSFRPKSFDVGLVQPDAVQADIRLTLQKLIRLYARKEQLVEEETDFLRSCAAGVMVCDIPGIPFEAAARLKIPRLAVGNLSWDWIYRSFADHDPRWWPVIRQFEHEYTQADLLLRLPFHGPMDAFPRIEDVTLVGRSGRARRTEIASALGLKDDAKKWILLSFTSLQWQSGALERLGTLQEYQFFAMKPADWRAKNVYTLDPRQFPFSDVVASVDAVVSKPGYGIISECILNRKPLLYTERPHFVEYEVLVAAIRRYLPNIFVTAENLYRGELAQALSALWVQPFPVETVSAGGDEIIARRIAQYHPALA
ncbi:MAG: hypothetical protein ACUVWX_05570 [Kiritimatiellia bacterium]